MPSENHSLHVFSAGAVAPPLQEATTIFEERNGVEVRVTVGKPANLLATIAKSRQGDLISCVAEFILDEAESGGLVLMGSRKSLGLRRSVILVPLGNPGRITRLEDLCRDGIRIGVAFDGCLKGIWDDIASKAGLTDEIRRNITQYADACGSLMGLIHRDEVDAIFAWNAFFNIWPNTCEIVELPRDLQIFRSTVIGMTRYAGDRAVSQKLIDFLVSDEGRKIYREHGWI